MGLDDILRKYEKMLAKDEQGNLAVFNGMYRDLRNCLKSQHKKRVLHSIYANYTSMRDGCEINKGSIKDAIKEIRLAL